MKWVKVDDYWYNADHIISFQWMRGALYVWDDGAVTSDVVDNVTTFEDKNGEKYKSLCGQLGLDCIAGTNEGGLSMKTCKACGAPIVWIKTPKGKAMPCDPVPVYYKDEPPRTKRIVKRNGEIIACEYAVDPAKATGMGYIPHWATCPAANRFRKGGKSR